MAGPTEFLFTMTTGRSGTKFLAELLRQNLPDAECHHEIIGWDRFGVDTPDLSHMTLFNSQGNIAQVRDFWAQKLDRVAASAGRVYVETSHLLMKAGLVENLGRLRAAGRVHLVALERDPYPTILSFLARGDFVENGNWWLWYLDPRYPKNLVDPRPIVDHGIAGICLWYIAEMRARAAFYERQLAGDPRVLVHRVTLDELTTAEGAARLIAGLGVERRPDEIVIPPIENASLRKAELSLAEDAALKELIRSMPFDAAGIAESSLRNGMHFR